MLPRSPGSYPNYNHKHCHNRDGFFFSIVTMVTCRFSFLKIFLATCTCNIDMGEVFRQYKDSTIINSVIQIKILDTILSVMCKTYVIIQEVFISGSKLNNNNNNLYFKNSILRKILKYNLDIFALYVLECSQLIYRIHSYDIFLLIIC